jgi:hypothetical protein
MQYHTDSEKALLETFRASGGERIIFFRHGQPQLPKPMADALSRLIRSGHVRRHSSGDFGWVCYRLRELGDEDEPVPLDGEGLVG